MTISATIVKQMVWGRQRVHFGTFLDSGAGTADTIDTGLRRCDFMIAWEKKATAPAEAIGLTTDFANQPVDGSKITMRVAIDTAGYWLAWGVGRTKGVG